jgi:hypothetical protein
MAFGTIPWDLIGHRVIGDIGPLTTYTDRYGRITVFKKAPPDKPATPAQRDRRNLFRDCVLAWKALSGDDKATLERCVHKLSLCLTGQNLFVSCSMKRQAGVYATCGRQSNETLPPLFEF